MAFGTNSDDIEIKISLDTAEAERKAQEFKQNTEAAVNSAGASATGASKGFGALEQRIIAINQAVQLSKEAFDILRGAISGVVALIDIGDKFGDIRDAFTENATAANILADELQNNLRRAVNGTIGDLELMTSANKAFAVGLDPKTFDELAAAAKKYADATGGEVTQALDQLIQGVNSGREALIRKFGTIKDGVLILNEFTQKTYEEGQAQSSVKDIVDQFGTSISNTYNRVAAAVNESELLKVATQAVTSVLSTLVELLGSAITGFIDFTNKAVRVVRQEIEDLSSGFSVLLEVIGQIRNGELPSLGKAIDVVSRQRMTALKKNTEDTSKVFVKLGKEAKGASKAIQDIDKEVRDALEGSDISINDILGLESFSLPGTSDSLRSKISAAFKQIRPQDIVNDLKGVRTAFLDGVVDVDELKKRISIFEKEMQKVQQGFKDQAGGPAIKSETTDPGKIFGIEFEGLTQELASQYESAISGALSLTQKAVTSGIGREDAAAIGSTIGTAIGAAIGATYGPGGAVAGGAIGSAIGGIIGSIASIFGEDTAGTKARKAADAFFADVFDADRLSVVIDGQLKRIRDLVFNPSAGGGGLLGGLPNGSSAINGVLSNVGISPGQLGAAPNGDDPFASGTFDDALLAQQQQIQGFFLSVGSAFEELLGVSDDIAGQIGAVLFNNIGGSLENLQILVQTTGKTFQELGDAIIQSFFNGTLSIQQAQDALVQLSDLYLPGIPGQVGAVKDAFDNFNIALADGKGSRLLLDSLRDIGAEAQELGVKDFPSLANQLVKVFGFSTTQIEAFFQALKATGINSIAELVNASNSQLIALARNVQLTTTGQTPTATPVADPTANITPPTNFSSGSSRSSGGSSGGNSGASAAKQREQELKRQREELFKLLTASQQYKDILSAINGETLKQSAASKQISLLYSDIKSATEDLSKAEDDYKKALENRGKTSKKELADLAKNLDDARKKLEQYTKAGQEQADAIKKANTQLFKDLTPLIHDMNTLGVVSRAVGITVEENSNILIQGFLRGKISIAEVNKQLKLTKDLLGEGIPNAVGDVNAAFTNLQKGGQNGGVFSVDAFKDIFAEFDELFNTGATAKRQVTLAQLTKSFDDARTELQRGIDGGETPDTIEALRKSFNGAKKALADFQNSTDKASLEDLRVELEKAFPKEQITIFFQALQESGVKTFSDFKNASDSTVVSILGKLNDLGFAFGQTTENINQITNAFDKASEAQTKGVDVLQKAVDLVALFNNGAQALPASLSDTSTALAALDAPLTVLADGFDTIFEQVAELNTVTINPKVVFDISTKGDLVAQNLFEILYGDGAGTSTPEEEGPGIGSGAKLSAEERSEFETLRRKRKNGQKLTSAERRRFRELTKKRGR